jgi:hypothetical protein
MVLDLARRRLGIGIIPGRIWVLLPIAEQRVIARLPLPRTSRRSRTGTEKLPLQRRLREVHIPFDRLIGFTFGNYDAVPNCLCHIGYNVRSRFLVPWKTHKREWVSLKGTGFSPYIRTRRIKGLKSLRDSNSPNPPTADTGRTLASHSLKPDWVCASPARNPEKMQVISLREQKPRSHARSWRLDRR